jgi:hypothetical protein
MDSNSLVAGHCRHMNEVCELIVLIVFQQHVLT